MERILNAHIISCLQSSPKSTILLSNSELRGCVAETVITERNNYQNFISATDVKIPATPEKKITVIEDKPVQAQSVESVKEAIQHGVHVQEMRMKEYLLPILLGAGVGFILLVLCVSLLVCCCCKRKLKKKMKMAKEMEKSSKDGKSIIDLVQGYGGVGGVHIL